MAPTKALAFSGVSMTKLVNILDVAIILPPVFLERWLMSHCYTVNILLAMKIVK